MSAVLRYGDFDVRLGQYRESREVQGKTYWKLRAAYKQKAIRHAVIDGKVWLIKSEVDGYLASTEESVGRSCDAQKTAASGNDVKRIAAALEDLAVTCRQLLAGRSEQVT